MVVIFFKSFCIVGFIPSYFPTLLSKFTEFGGILGRLNQWPLDVRCQQPNTRPFVFQNPPPPYVLVAMDFFQTIANGIIPRWLFVHFIRWNSWSWHLAQEFIRARSNLGGLFVVKVDIIYNFMSRDNWPRLLDDLHQSLLLNDVRCTILHGCSYQKGIELPANR